MTRTILAFNGGLKSTVALYELLAKGQEVRPVWFFTPEPNNGRQTAAALRIATALSNAGRIPGFNAVDLEASLSQLNIASTMARNGRAWMKPGWDIIFAGFLEGLVQCRGYTEAAMVWDVPNTPGLQLHAVLTEGPRLLSDVIKRGAKLNVPFEETWSCDRDGANHCGECESCLFRKAGFLAADVEDPTVYTPDGRPDLQVV